MTSGELVSRGSVWLATGLGAGLVTPAPGTIGGLWGLPLAWAVGQLGTDDQPTAIVLLVLVAIAICSRAAQGLGGGKDPQAIVLDEIVALPIVYLGVSERGPAIWIAGYLLFRLFDISKPFPVRQVERIPGAWGVVLDDCLAAGYACLALHALLWLDRVLNVSWLATT